MLKALRSFLNPTARGGLHYMTAVSVHGGLVMGY